MIQDNYFYSILQVVEYRIDKLSASGTELMKPGSFFKTHAIKTKYGFDRVVEDLIQEAMSKGEFENLECAGKPLSHAQSQNPYVDFTQHKLNKILLDNGFTPEWITLQKEIRIDIKDLEKILTEYRSYIGEVPLNSTDADEWSKVLERLEYRATDINKKINKYNLITPILDQQMCQIRFEKIADKVLNTKPVKRSQKVPNNLNEQKENYENSNKTFLSSLIWWT